jgi:hypothetical protein
MVKDLLSRYLVIGTDVDSISGIIGSPDISVPEKYVRVRAGAAWRKIVFHVAYSLEPLSALKKRFERALILAFELGGKLCWRGVVRFRIVGRTRFNDLY